MSLIFLCRCVLTRFYVYVSSPVPEQLEAELAADGSVAFAIAYKKTGGEQTSGKAIAYLEVRMVAMSIEPGDIDTLHLHVMTDKGQPAEQEQRRLISEIATDVIR